VGFIDNKKGIVLCTQRREFLDGGDIAVHREHGVSDDNLTCSGVRSKVGCEMVEIEMSVPVHGSAICAGHATAIDD
jgi:hypothetical protein